MNAYININASQIEQFAFSIPECEVKAHSVEIEQDMVNFTLKYGCIELDCKMKATPLPTSAYLESQFAPEYGLDIEYEKLAIDIYTLVLVTRSDSPNVNDGATLKLTEKQVQEINEWLDEIAIESLQSIAVVACGDSTDEHLC